MEWFERVKAIKKQKNITTEMLSEQTGIAKGTLNKLLTGQTKNPSYDTIERIAASIRANLRFGEPGRKDSSPCRPSSRTAERGHCRFRPTAGSRTTFCR